MTGPPDGGRIGLRPRPGAASRIVAIASLAVVCAAGAGILLYLLRSESSTRERWRSRLLLTAEERARAIEEYLDDRSADASIFASFPTVREVARLPGGPSSEATARHLREVLELARRSWGSRSLAILWPSPAEPFVVGEPVEKEIRAAFGRAAEVRRVSAVPTSAGVRVVFAAPAATTEDGEAAAWLVIVDDPADRLWGALGREPGAMNSEEIVLVRVRGGRIEHLSPGSGPGSGRTPPLVAIADAEVPARDAVLGREGVGEYLDDRGRKVLAAVRRLPETRWGLVVKVDVDEALAGLARERLWTGGALLLLAAALFALVRAVRGRERLERAEERGRQLERHRTVLEYARDAVVWVRPEDGRLLEANRAAETLWGYPRAELLQRAVSDLEAPGERLAQWSHREGARGEGALFRVRHVRKDGSVIPVEVSSRPVRLDGEDVVVAVVRDVTENEAMLARVRLLNRLLRTIAAVDEALVGVRERTTILERVCGEIVATGEFAAAWFGVPDGEGRLRPAASAGRAAGLPGGRDPSLAGASAARAAEAAYVEERTVVLDDEAASALPRSHSAAAAPVRGETGLRGVLAISAAEPHAFGPDAVLLLEELARDVGLALDLADAEARRTRAEASLAESEARYRTLFEENPAPMWVFDVETLGFLAVNEAATTLYGWSREEFLGLSLREIRPPAEVSALEADVLVPRTGVRRSGPWRHRRRDGSEIRVEIATYDVKFDGRPARLALVNDLTARLRAEEKLRAFFEAGMFGALFADVHGNVLAANDEYLRIVGYSREELESGALKWTDITPPEWLGVDAERIAEAKRRGVCTPYEKEYRRKDGSRVPVLVGYALVGEEREESVAFVLDLSQRKAAEARLAETTQLLQAVVEGSPAPILTLDREGRVTSWNPAAEAVFGWTEAEAIGEALPIVPPEAGGEFRSFLEAILSGQSFAGREVRRRRKDGTPVDVSLAAAPLRSAGGPVEGVVGILLDVSARLRAEAEVRRLNGELEQRVEQRTAELVAKTRELESFAYSVSHDLRAPLRAIDGFSRILEEDHAAQLDEEGLRLLGVVRSNARRMGQLIDDLLAFSRAGRHELRRGRVDVAELVRSVLAEVLPPEEEGRSDVSVGELPFAEADPSLLRQVFVNLLSNAVKFSATRPRRSIRVEGRREPGRVVYDICDNGVGFDMRYVDKLFGVFQRLHGREFDGTGVGLALVERIVGRHGGTVSGSGEPGRGATFRFTLPDGGGEG